VRLAELSELADALEAACDAPDALVDRHEHQLDATTLERLADACEVLRQRSAAVGDRRSADAMATRVAFVRERAAAWRSYSDAKEAGDKGEWELARSKFDESVAQRRRLVARDARLQLRWELADALDEAANAAEEVDDLEAAAQHFAEALQVLVYLRRDRDHRGDRWAHRIVALGAGRIAQSLGRLNDAAAHFACALDLVLASVANDEAPEDVAEAAERANRPAWPAVRLAQVHLARGDAAACAAALAQAQPWIAALEHPDLMDPNSLDTAAAFYETQAQAAEASGDRKLAKSATDAAAALRARIAALTDDSED